MRRRSWSRRGGSLLSPSDSEPATYLLPGFVDAHVHVESSMLVPSEFARAAVVHGTVATVSDPHEIGNVLGVAGVAVHAGERARRCRSSSTSARRRACRRRRSKRPARRSPSPRSSSCSTIRGFVYLSEMMNFPGVLGGDPECLAKIARRTNRGKPVDGHAPGLRGAEAAAVHRRGHHDRPRVLHQGGSARQDRRRLQDLDPRRFGGPQLRRPLHAASASIPA